MTSEQAPARVYFRPSSQDLGEMPLDSDVARQALATLAPKELGVWFALHFRIWAYGELPRSEKRLAAIGRVTPRAFAAMRPAIAPLFDHDQYGRWRDYDLEAARDRRLEIDPSERVSFEPSDGAPGAAVDIEGPDEALREKRRQAGLRGSEKRWAAERRKRLQLVQGGRGAIDAKDGKSEDFAMAPLPSTDSKNADKIDDVGSVDLPAFLPSGVSRTHPDGLTDGSSPLEEENSTVSPSESPRDSHGATCCWDGKTDNSLDGKPGNSTDGKAPSGKVPSDAEIAEVIRRAVAKGGGTLDAGWQSSKCLETLRAAFADGCDLKRHYEPALLAFTERCKDKRIRHPANDPIMRGTWSLRSHDVEGAAVTPTRPDISHLSAMDQGLHLVLETKLGLDVYVSWCGSLVISRISADRAILAVRSRFVRQHLERHFGEPLLAAVKTIAPDVRKIEMIVGEAPVAT